MRLRGSYGLLLSLLLALASSVLLAACGGGSSPDPDPGAGDSTDTVGPVLQLSGVSAGQSISDAPRVTLTATDASGLAMLRLLIDGDEVATAAGGSLEWDSAGRLSVPGEHTILARGEDIHGNAGELSLSVTGANVAGVMTVSAASEKEALEAFPLFFAPRPQHYVDGDTTLPRPLLFGLSAGQRVAGTVQLSAYGFDDHGVEAMHAYGADGQDWYSANAQLNLQWDTTALPDGHFTFTIFLLDRGLNVSRCEIPVEIVNDGDHSGPELGFSQPLDVPHYGSVDLHIIAKDASEIKFIQLHRKLFGGARELLAESTGGQPLHWSWQPYQEPEPTMCNLEMEVIVLAEDALGNQTRYDQQILSYNGVGLESDFYTQRNGSFASIDSLRVERISGRGDWAQQRPAVFELRLTDKTYNNKPQRILCVAGSDEPAGMVPFGIYRYELKADDYVQTWTQPHTLWEAEELLPDPQHQTWGQLTSGHLPGMYWKPYSGQRNFLFCPGQDSFELPAHASRYLTGVVRCSRIAEVLSEPALHNAQTIFIGGGNSDEASMLADPVAMELLRSWVTDGGTLYLSAGAYDFLEQLVPQRVAFSGSVGISGLDAVPEPRDAAETEEWGAEIYLGKNHWKVDGIGKVTADYINGSGGKYPRILAVQEVRTAVLIDVEGTVTAGAKLEPIVISTSYGAGRIVYSALPLASGPSASQGSKAVGLADLLWHPNN